MIFVNFSENNELLVTDPELIQDDTSESVVQDEQIDQVESPEESELVEDVESTEAVDSVIYFTEPAPDYSEVLNRISDTLSDISAETVSDYSVSTLSLSGGKLDAYYFVYGSDTVYIPYDKISYFTTTSDDRLVNISSSAINCYSMDDSGNKGTSYRFPSFGTAQIYVNSGNSYYWNNIDVYASDSNLVIGQTGINNFTDLLLYGILLLLAVLVFLRRK